MRTRRRRVELGDGVAYETCDPEPTDPRTKEALADMVRAAARHIREQQRVHWEYHRELWNYPSEQQGDQRLANLGGDGWELILIDRVPGSTDPRLNRPARAWAVFKRPVY